MGGIDSLSYAAREGMRWAGEAAFHHGRAEIRPVDIAVGMLAVPSSVAARSMAKLGVTHASARLALQTVAPSDALDHGTPITFSLAARKVIRLAFDERAAQDPE